MSIFLETKVWDHMRSQEVNIKKESCNREKYPIGRYVNAQERVCIWIGGDVNRIIHSVHKVFLYYRRLGKVMLHILWIYKTFLRASDNNCSVPINILPETNL